MDDSILEPIDLYQSKLKELHLQNTKEYFDDLVKKSGINVEENKQTSQKIQKKKMELENIKKKISKYHSYKSLSIIGIVLFSIVGIFLLYQSIQYALDLWIGIVSIILAVIIDVLFILLIVKKLNVILKNTDQIKVKLENEIQELNQLAWEQMSPLNQLYDWNMGADIMKKTTPLLQLDQYFDAKKCQYMMEKYGLLENDEENISTCMVQSGSILGNPFLILRNYSQNWTQHIYSGALVIHWTEVHRDSDGHVRHVNRSQTLTATITKPVPTYGYNTYLVYGNDAAPNLSFSRNPSHIEGKSEKEIEKIIKEGAKDLDQKAREAVSKNSQYTRLGNDEFEVLFGGENRNNEVEFRLLFTPLAQKNEINLIKNTIGYGDDFYLEKNGRLNYVKSNHSQNQNYDNNPNMFVSNNYEEAREKFIQYHMEYFKSIFFDLAPLISIPLYQQYKPKEYIYHSNYPSNITRFEHESIANSFPIEQLKHPKTATNVILKTNFIQRDQQADRVNIRAHSFATASRVDFVPVLGGDGHMHNVPVPWVEYLPIYKDTVMEVKAQDTSRHEFNAKQKDAAFMAFMHSLSGSNPYLYERGLLAALIIREVVERDVEEWSGFFKNTNSNIQNSNANNSNIQNNENKGEE